MSRAIDHDGAFKLLLTQFFEEFLSAFAPGLTEVLEASSFTFLATESFADILDPDKRNADLLVRARLRGQPATILVHLEHQAQRQRTIDQRMFRYFARFYDRYKQPIYPIVLFSNQDSKQLAPHEHRVVIGNKTILDFQYQVVQLSRLNWRDYLGTTNPAAVALMARMGVAAEDRWRVKAACLRQAIGLPNQTARLIAQFVDLYLPLSAPEETAFQREIAAFAPIEKERVMEIVTTWERRAQAKGLAEGRAEGRAEGELRAVRDLVLRLINKKFGPNVRGVKSRVAKLTKDQLDELAPALLDIQSGAELLTWIDERREEQAHTDTLPPQE